MVTALFSDLVGFTSASERFDPEDVQDVLHAYHSAVRERVESYGGQVERLVGDGVLAVFGAPVLREDDAERAVRAALAVVESVRGLHWSDGTSPVEVRVGVDTGVALVDLSEGADLSLTSHWINGDVINTADRLQKAAAPGTVLVGEVTYRATSPVIAYESMEPIHAKGKQEPVAARRALGPLLPFGAEVYLDLDVAFVGRELELRQLRTAFDRVVHESRVHLVAIIGDPGVGKSRLVAELLARLANDVTCRLGRVPPYGEATGFSALAEVVRAHAGIYDTDAPDAVDRKLAACLAGWPDDIWLMDRLRPLLGLEVGREVTLADTFSAGWRFLEGLTAGGPAVVVFEDVHQADPQLLRFVEGLAEAAPPVPLLVLVTARPELVTDSTGWAVGLRNASLVDLPPLSDQETRSLLRQLLGEVALPAETEQAILERAEGNPLFTAEFVRMLRDRDLVEPVTSGRTRPFVDVPLPETIYGVIVSRFDLVEGHTRGALLDAAVVGRVFWTGTVAALTGRSTDDVTADLRRLARLGVVRQLLRSTMAGETEWCFQHALMRDAAYNVPKRSTRARKHLQAADWLSERMPAGVDEFSEALAYHAGTALQLAITTGDEELARESRTRLLASYLTAADAAEAVSALPKALAHLDAAWDLVHDEPTSAAEAAALEQRSAALRRRLVAGPPRDHQGHGGAGAHAADDHLSGSTAPAGGRAAVPAGRQAHQATPDGDTRRTLRLEGWEVLLSADRGFYDPESVPDPFPEAPGQRRVVLAGDVVRVGRGSEADVNFGPLPVDGYVSRVHVELHRDGAGWQLTQVSEKPTYLNGIRLITPGELLPLRDGDFLQIGGWTRVTLRRIPAGPPGDDPSTRPVAGGGG